MKRKDGVALIITAVAIVFVVFFILPTFGINIPDPFRPSTTAYVSIYADCAILGCNFDSSTTYVGFGKPSPDKPWWALSVVEKSTGIKTEAPAPVFILSEIFPSIPEEQIGLTAPAIPPSLPSLSFIPTCLFEWAGVKGGVDIAVKFSISSLNYESTKPFGGFHWCGGDPNPFVQSFTFNYAKGQTYYWVVEVINSKTGTTLYMKQGSQYLG